MKVVVCGGLRIDYIITATGEARLNQIGGNAIYAAVGARHWTESVHLLARAGENYPQEWLDELTGRGIGTSMVRRLPGWHEMRTFYAYIDEKTRVDREPVIHFQRIGQPLPLELEGYNHSLYENYNPESPLVLRASDVTDTLSGADAVHLAPLALRSQSELVQAFRRSGRAQITLDPGEYRHTPDTVATVKEYCSVIDAFLPSELEVRLLLGIDDPFQAAEIFAAWGASLVVIKRGPDGCLFYERDADNFTTVPAYPTRVVDVTGAGDSFGGGFAVGLRQTGDPLQAALMGTVSASLAIEGYGALHALDTPRAEAERRLMELAGGGG
ncbi:MAG: PfkB family carbohydrate kinase, partial [Chloroflexota bacterium]|nr:PfkB family carbohydrate kinase [Chloroflexota bacterium]